MFIKTYDDDDAIQIAIHDESDINHTLNQRCLRYGSFDEHARITQSIKQIMQSGESWAKTDDAQKEALEMIAHKLGRIVNGDPNYDDSWRDIAGYATLIVNQINGND